MVFLSAHSFFKPVEVSTVDDTRNMSMGSKATVENINPNASIVVNVANSSESLLL
jgi:hypothetical protein